MLQWALITLKMAVYQNLEGARAHYDSYGTYKIYFIILLLARIWADISFSGIVMKEPETSRIMDSIVMDQT